MQRTKIGMIAALVVLAAVFWAADAWTQNRSDPIQSVNKVKQGSRQSTVAVPDKLPKIDRLAKNGLMFTDWYSRQSCTSGPAAMATGRYPIRSGPPEIFLPGAD